MEISISLLAIFLLISNYFAIISSNSSLNLITDQQALLAFKNSITDPNAILLNNWTINIPTCRWTGVSCSPKHQRVSSLNVSGFGLLGTLSPYLGNLTFLRLLDISSNMFGGSLTSELSKLRRLEEIDVGANNFTGEIPSWLGALPQLRRMYLYRNSFSGGIPPSLFNISRIQILNVRYNNLGGNIPDEIGNVSSLRVINLGRNKLSGKLPDNVCSDIAGLEEFTVDNNQLEGEILPSICSCRELQILQLQQNQFNGNIPIEIGSLSKLVYMHIKENQFKGAIPKQIGNLTSLRVLILESNNITGNIPKQIGNLTSLAVVRLGHNKLAGELPQELANLAFLDNFTADGNTLSGSIPQYIFNMSALSILDLAVNEFSGTLPHHQGLSLPNLEELYLWGNSFTGPIPSCITNASMLNVLDMSTNFFDGIMPNFGNLKILEQLRIWGNRLHGAKSPAQKLEFISSLTNCRNLEIIEVSFNPLNGILPKSIGNLSDSLRYFAANAANITGVIPSEIGNLKNLKILQMSDNQLTGFIPTTMGKLKGLQVLFLSKSRLQGSMPVDLCNLSNVGDLFLDGNLLTGSLPECFGGLKTLRNIGLGSNKLNSSLPSTLWNLRDVITLNLSSNDFSGRISSQISQMKVATIIDLSSNKFSGEIPATIDGCESLDILNLSNNKFVGSIPPSLGNDRGLTNIDLSNNSLFGSIPKSLEKLPFLDYFNVSYNNLQGEIPNGGNFVNFTAQSFAHNYDLCGASRFEVRPCAKNQGTSRTVSVSLLMRYILPVFISVVILAVVVIKLMRRRKQFRVINPNDHTSLGNAWRVISYTELERATSFFSETKLLGRGSFGSVFKGTLTDGMNIAVKVFNIQSDRANKSFTTESKILSTIRHRNLVKIISSCTNMEFKALILEFMPNGSLEKWLYFDHHCMDIFLLLNIAIDVSLAVEYLHHGDTFPVVHCDIKPSNILLDEDMTARVADFGIAKLFNEGEDMIRTKTLATIGYVAPEYGSEGKVSTSADVYSYGIMLLEMFTRKKPTDDMFNEEMSLKDWVSSAIQENSIHEILAPGLLSEDDRHFVAKEQCVACVFGVAMKCVAILPYERINMNEAAAAMQKIKAKFVAGVTTRRQYHAISIA